MMNTPESVSIRASARTVWRITCKRIDQATDLSGTVSASLVVRRPDGSLVTWTATVFSAAADAVEVHHAFSAADFAGAGEYVAEPQLVDGSGLAVQGTPATVQGVDI